MNEGTCGSLTGRQLQTYDVQDTCIGLQLRVSGVMGARRYASVLAEGQTLWATQFSHVCDKE